MKFIIKQKILIAMLFIALTMLGYFSYRQLPVELYPNTQIPFLFVQVGSVLEVDPKYMENQAIIPIEGAIGTMKGVEKIESTAGQQRGTIQISYQPGTNIKYAYLKLVEKIDEIKKTLPTEFRVQVFKFDIEMINNQFMTLQVRGGGGVDRVRQVVDMEILTRVQNINGVANVAVFGGRQKSIEIILNEDVCKSHGITPANVRSAINQNSRARTFAGKVTQNNQLHFVNVVSEYADIRNIEDIVVKTQGNLKLKDVASINFGFKEESSYSRVNGKEAVTLQLTRDSHANMIELANRVIDQMEVINTELKSKDIEMVVQNNSAETMEKNIDLIINLAITGGILAVFILWIFLKNIRLVITISLAIPISVYTAFNFFYAYGITINSLTLLGMALAIGMLVDNSVVVMENIYRLASKKVGIDKAVVQGTTEVWRSILASTLTTIMVFLPFAFSENFLVGLLGKNVGVSIVSTLLVSLVVALLLIPMITHSLLKFRSRDNEFIFENISRHNRVIQIYQVLLKTCMRNPAGTVMGALGIFFVTLLISLGISFFSTQEPEVTNLTLYATMPGGTTLENTDLIIAEVEKRLVKLPEKKDVISQVYEEEAVLTISLIKEFKNLRNFSVPKIKKEILDRLKDINQVSFSWDPPVSGRRFGGRGNDAEAGLGRMMGIGSQAEKVVIKGQDYDKIHSQAQKVKYYLTQLSSVTSININIPSARPEISLGFNKQMMALYDIPLTSVLSELNSFPREFSSGVKFKQGADEYDIQIRTLSNNKEKERNFNELKHLPVRGANVSEFELQNISDFNFTQGLSSIKRINQEKQLEVSYAIIDDIATEKDMLEAARLEVDNLISSINPQSGVAMEVVHGEEDLSDFKFLILAAFILIFMIMASVFESFLTPVVMMFSIPLAAIGSLVALILTGSSLLNANTLTGFIILIGIVVNNGIILIDYTNVLQNRGYNQSRAMMMAGLARLRPILITAITTVIALFPLAMGKAEYVTQIGTPFAITVIGGLSLSTLLTLVFIPTLNSGLKSAMLWIRSQKLYIKLIQLAVCIAGTFYIYYEIDSLVWKIIDYILLFILVPAGFYFVQTSLRRASEKLIDESAPIIITIRNLVKIYDRDSRFVREWKSGIKIRERLGLERKYESWKELDYLVWQLPIVGFLVYFIYFYLESGLYFFILPLGIYLLMLHILTPLKKYAFWLNKSRDMRWPLKIAALLYNLFFWTFPALALYIFNKKYSLIGVVIPAAFLWYLALMVKKTSDKLYKEKININRISGRFRGIRKGFYRFVQVIPVIGRKKTPFKALKGVSFDIEKGMFGLLGPNGAGKSTLMRIICGILEPSYGLITFNGIDIQEKREELQGLIGYLPQEFGMYENLTASEFLNYMGILKKIYNRKEREDRVDYVLGAVHMIGHKDEKIGSFSGGMKQRIGIAQILMHLPRILVVDEPTAGLDPRERIRFRNLLVELSQERIVIFSTHIIEDVASSCNRVAVIKGGEVKYLGKPIDMARIAEGKVWMIDMSIEEFEEFKGKHVIIHHMRDGDKIRVRCMADSSPSSGSTAVKANLEDAYLCLLGGSNNGN